MDRRKALVDQYRQRKVTGGVFRLTNTRNGRYLLDCAADIQARQNSFAFVSSTGAVFDYRLKKEWEECGAGVFVFEVLETLEKKKDQSQEAFLEDLKTLEQMWSEKLDPAKSY